MHQKSFKKALKESPTSPSGALKRATSSPCRYVVRRLVRRRHRRDIVVVVAKAAEVHNLLKIIMIKKTDKKSIENQTKHKQRVLKEP